MFAIGEPVQRALRARDAPMDRLGENLRSLVDFEVAKAVLAAGCLCCAKGYDGRRVVAARGIIPCLLDVSDFMMRR